MQIDIEKQIDRNASEPAYLQLANIIQGKISNGEYRSGDRLPSESQLRKQYALSPMTIRRAVNTLIEKDVVYTTKGLGTFVSSLKIQKVTFSLEELFKMLNSDGNMRIKILEASIVKTDDNISRLLNNPLNSNAILIRRLFTKEQQPMIYHREFLIYDPRKPIVEGELQISSLLDLFSGSDESDLKWGNIKISAATMTVEEAKALHCPPGSAALHMEHTFFDFDDNQRSWGVFICRADVFHLEATVGKVMDRNSKTQEGLAL